MGLDLSVSYGARPVLQGVTARLGPGQSFAIVGPNGAGKSTLLNVLSGALTPVRGSVSLGDQPISSLSRRDLARRMAVVPQRLEIGFGLTGRDVVALGRTPYLGFLGSGRTEDRLAIERAIVDTDIQNFVDRPFSQLSGGEAQRTILAMALAQESTFLLLDEPTVHLDMGQQWRLLKKLRALCSQRGVGVLAVIHDLNLVSLGFDRVLLLAMGRPVAEGVPEDVLTEDNLREAFDAPIRVRRDGPSIRVALDPED